MKVTVDNQTYDIDEQYRDDLVGWLKWLIDYPNPRTVDVREIVCDARKKTGTQLNFGFPEFT